MNDTEEKDLILIVEDSNYLNDYMASHLRKANYDVVQTHTLKEAYEALSSDCFSLVILDLNLGGDNGMDVLHYIRLQNKFLPVMIVSAIQDDKTKIQGFREGCDDYITKPFYIEELLLRIKRMLDKLSRMSFSKQNVENSYSSGIFTVVVDSQIVTKNGVQIQMRKKQFDLMLYFVQHPNVILSLQNIYESVWNEAAPDSKTLESNMYVNIRSLRMLIEEDKNNPKHIVSVSKFGYIFVPE